MIGGPSHLYCPLILPGPHARHLADTKVAVLFWSYQQERKPFYELWGSHRVQYLFQALSLAKIRITELCIGDWQDHDRPLKIGLSLCSLKVPNAIDQVRFTMDA